MSNSYANKFIIYFYQNDNYYKYCIEYKDIKYSTQDIEDFSKKLRNIGKDYFDFSSVSVDNNTKIMKLSDFKSLKDYELCLRGDIEYQPNIILDYECNDLVLPSKIKLQNINSLKFYSRLYHDLDNDIVNKINIDVNDTNKIFLNDKPMLIEHCTLEINDTQITDIKAISKITEKLYNTKPESIMDIMYFMWYIVKVPLKWVGLLK